MELWVRARIIQLKYIIEIYNVIVSFIIGLCCFYKGFFVGGELKNFKIFLLACK